ncbi:MAG: polysaccharide pyruvyl transferase family protein [Roseburia sp.]
MKTVFANTIGSISERKGELSGKDAFSLCGGNTGNVCFVDAVKEQLAYDEEISCYKIDWYKDKAVFVLPASNWINIDGHVLRDIFLPLENKDVQLSVLGLGVQIDLNNSIDDFIIELSKNRDTIRALKIISEHSKYIGIRGNVTGECLDKLGIHNWKVIGCPSFYEPFRKYGEIKLDKCTSGQVVINVTPGKFGEHKMLEYGIKNKKDIVLQAMQDMPLVLWENRPIEERHLRQKFPGLEDVTTSEVQDYIKEFGHMFYTRDDWSDYLIEKKVSFSIGSRFHGNMMALSNGMPALWVVHDVRTKELVDAMKLPHITYQELLKYSVDELKDMCNYGQDFYDNYCSMGREYVELLNQCDVKHNFNREGVYSW